MLNLTPTLLPSVRTAAQATLVLAALLLSVSFAHAQAPTPAPGARDPALPVVPFGNLGKSSDDDIARARRLAEDMARSMQSGFAAPPRAEALRLGQELTRRADDIADAALAADRDKVLRFLGLDPEGATSLYYFVSWSMPLAMLRSYAIEAMWSGGTLVFKGVPPGKEVGTFLVNDLRNLVYGKGASANVSLDPRLFDAYNVSVVPTVVLTRSRDNLQCDVDSSPVKVGEQTVSYSKCPPVDSSLYWKMSGAVTGVFALEQFKQSGAKEADAYLSALSKGWAGRPKPGKGQVAFAGKWEDVLSPEQQRAAIDAARARGQLPVAPAAQPSTRGNRSAAPVPRAVR